MRRERVIIYAVLYFSTIAIALVTGFRTGEAIVEPQIIREKEIVEVPNPLDSRAIILSRTTQEQLENYIAETGNPITLETKLKTVEEALDNYFVAETSVLATTPSPVTNETTSSTLSDVDDAVSSTFSEAVQASQLSTSAKGFRFDFYDCSRTGERGVIRCDFAVVNQEEDRTLQILASDSPESQIIDANGTLYIAAKIDFGTVSSRTRARTKFVQDISVPGSLTFTNIPEEINTLNLLEINNYSSSGDEYFSIQFRDIAVSN